MNKINKSADKSITTNETEKEKEYPTPIILATYVEALRIYLEETPNLDPKMTNVIKQLPPPAKIRSEFGNDEANALFETVAWAWEKISGNKILDELKVTEAPEHMMGNYWMLENGVILGGENHFTIIKNNINLFSILLEINSMALSFIKDMSTEPNKAIHKAICNGAIRIFINVKKEAYFQISAKAYRKWGRAKIKKLDYKKKSIKVIDCSKPYLGWDSGITVKL